MAQNLHYFIMNTPRLHCWGTNFYIAGLNKLEKIAFNIKELKQLYNSLKSNSLEQVTVLSTCNRFEIYWTGENDIRIKLTNIISNFKNDIPDIINDFYYLQDTDAFKHLVFVNLGFDSMINLEEDISNQVKNSYIIANNILMLNKLIHLIFQSTIHISRQIKNKYSLSQFRFSLTDCVIKIISKIFSNLKNNNVLILGTGILAKNIINKIYGVTKSIGVYSCHEERVNNLMVELNKKINKVTKKTDFSNYDIIIGSTNARGFLVTPEDIKKTTNKIILFDLGVPRNISPQLANAENIFLFTLDDIYSFHRELFKEKSQEVDRIKDSIENEILHTWNKILTEISGFDWNSFNEKIRSEIFTNLKARFNGSIDNSAINKLTYNILKDIKNNLVKKL